MYENTGLFIIILDKYMYDLDNSYNNDYIDNILIIKYINKLNMCLYNHSKTKNFKNMYNTQFTNLNKYLKLKQSKINDLIPNAYYRPYECIANWKHYVINYNNNNNTLLVCPDCGSYVTPRRYSQYY